MANAKILIVDDETIVLKAYARELEDCGYEVFRAKTGSDALELVKKEKIDLVFTDLIMPELNGVELCKKIKEISPSTIVVLMSGYPEEVAKYHYDFIKAGGKDMILRKPLLPNELPNTAAKILKGVGKGCENGSDINH